MTRTILLGVAVILGLLLIAVLAYFYHLSRAPLPRLTGEIAVAGLQAPVEILRDEWSVPHIYARNPQDLFFAQGFVHANDRWWQMEFYRHLSQGRLGELLGTGALENDILNRSLGFSRVAAQEEQLYDPETWSYLQSFADGVNAYLQNRNPARLSLQYSILGFAGLQFEVDPWTPVDTLTYAKFMSLNMSANLGFELAYNDLAVLLGPELVADFFPPFPYGEKPAILNPADLPQVTASERSPLETAPFPLFGSVSQEIPAIIGQKPWIGSNAWVVSGDLTVSGRPLLAIDPHLLADLPSIWYEIGLHCRPLGEECPFDVAGFTFSPFPGVAVGHNGKIAWGATVAGPDVQDVYVIRQNPGDPFQYEWDGSWRDMIIHAETFYFGDGTEPVNLQMRATHLGPIFNDYEQVGETGQIGGHNLEEPLALRWTALEPGTFFNAIFGLNRAADWDDFLRALEDWDFGSMNIVYADVAGNIGYQMPGKIPIRSTGHTGLTPAPGWNEAFEWQGYLPYELLPRIFNPERGYIVTANQAIAPPEYWEWLAQQLGPQYNYNFQQIWPIYGYRAERIEEMLAAGIPHNTASFQAMQGDNYLIHAREVLPYLTNLDFAKDELNEAREALLAWNRQLERGSPQAALYAQFWRYLSDNLFNDRLEGPYRASSVHMWPASRLMADPHNPWWDDTRTPDIIETRDDILSRSFHSAYQATVAALGADAGRWRWADLHSVTFVNQPLGGSGVRLLEGVFTRGPYGLDGGANVVNQTGWSEDHDNYFSVQVLPSMRLIVDLGDLDRSIVMNSTGQSGHPFSDHYDDMIEPWRNHEYRMMLWSQEQVEAAAVSRLILYPADS